VVVLPTPPLAFKTANETVIVLTPPPDIHAVLLVRVYS